MPSSDARPLTPSVTEEPRMHLPTTGRGPLVLHLTQPVDGGVARVVRDLVRAQRAAGLRVAVACPDGSGLADTLRALGADVHDWPATRAPGRALPGEVRRLRRVLAGTRPDLVHAHSAKAGLAARLAVRGRVPTVFQPHAWSFEAVDGALAALAVRWERWGARWAARVVCVSEAERATGVRAGVRASWSVVPNGVDTEHHRPAPHAGARAGLGLLADTEPSDPLVVCVGRLCRQKGQDVLLRAWPAVVRRVPRARLVLVGDGPEEARLRASAPASVLFAGAVDDVVPWYRAADVVVLPSRWEGMALAPLEAMACGRPVVLTEVAGARECLPPGQEPVPVEQPGPLADRIAALLLDPPLRARLGKEARAHVVATHDVRRTAEAVMEVYRELLAAGPTAGAPPRDPEPAGDRRGTGDVRGGRGAGDVRDTRGAETVRAARGAWAARSMRDARGPAGRPTVWEAAGAWAARAATGARTVWGAPDPAGPPTARKTTGTWALWAATSARAVWGAPGPAGPPAARKAAGAWAARAVTGVRAVWGVAGLRALRGASGVRGASVAGARAAVCAAHSPETLRRPRRADHAPGGGSAPCASCVVHAAHTTGAEATECRESSHT
jgi:glycosyltransferase involved in cell wall biosynthesis